LESNYWEGEGKEGRGPGKRAKGQGRGQKGMTMIGIKLDKKRKVWYNGRRMVKKEKKEKKTYG